MKFGSSDVKTNQPQRQTDAGSPGPGLSLTTFTNNRGNAKTSAPLSIFSLPVGFFSGLVRTFRPNQIETSSIVFRIEFDHFTIEVLQDEFEALCVEVGVGPNALRHEAVLVHGNEYERETKGASVARRTVGRESQSIFP